MVFKLARTYGDPTQPQNAQRGYPAPGAGAQISGGPLLAPGSNVPVAQETVRPTKGMLSWFRPTSPQSLQRGLPAPEDAAQQRPVGSMPARVIQGGRPLVTETPYYDRGAAAFVQNFGLTQVNPIGAGIQVNDRVQASYGPSTVYENGRIFFSPQTIPTSVPSSPLTETSDLARMFGPIDIQALVRTD